RRPRGLGRLRTRNRRRKRGNDRGLVLGRRQVWRELPRPATEQHGSANQRSRSNHSGTLSGTGESVDDSPPSPDSGGSSGTPSGTSPCGEWKRRIGRGSGVFGAASVPA